MRCEQRRIYDDRILQNTKQAIVVKRMRCSFQHESMKVHLIMCRRNHNHNMQWLQRSSIQAYVTSVQLIRFVTSYSICHDRTKPCFEQNVLCCTYSINNIVNRRLPVEKLFCPEYSDAQRQLVGLTRKYVFITNNRLFLPREFHDIFEDFINFLCVYS